MRSIVAIVALLVSSVALAQPPLPPTPAPSFQTRLEWAAPTTNTDGSALTDLAGYEVFYAAGLDAAWSDPIDVPADRVAYVLTQNTLQPDTLYYFTVRAYNAEGVRSEYSNIASGRTPDPKQPNAPRDVVVTITFSVE